MRSGSSDTALTPFKAWVWKILGYWGRVCVQDFGGDGRKSGGLFGGYVALVDVLVLA
jgi:hypothetical protein